jgi:hypothetical protein
MYYLVNVDHNGMAAHHTRIDCEGFDEMLYIQCNRWNLWWFVVEWQGTIMNYGDVRSECEEDESTECEDGDSDTNWQW